MSDLVILGLASVAAGLLTIVVLCVAACVVAGRADAIDAAAAPESGPVPPRAPTCDAFRPHAVRISADGTHWVCARSGCGQRWERDVPKAVTQPYDQELDLRNEDWQAWDRQVWAS